MTTVPLGQVPLEWIEKRIHGSNATAGREYADILRQRVDWATADPCWQFVW